MSGLKFSSEVTSFLPDNLSGLKKIIFRPDFTYYLVVSIIDFEQLSAGSEGIQSKILKF